MHWRTVVIILTFTLFYAVLGGIILHLIEAPHEQQIKEGSRQTIFQFLANRPCINMSTVLALSKLFDQAATAGLHAFPGSSNLTYVTNWDLSSSIFLAFQVIGSVGNGNAPPKTTGGRVFCIIFAMFGIPLLLSAGLGIGYMMIAGAERLRKCCIRNAGPRDAVRVQVVRSLIIFFTSFILLVLIPAGIFTAIEKEWTFGDSIYFCLTSVLTIGFGDFVPGSDWSGSSVNLYRLAVGFWLIISLLVFSGLWNSINLAIGSTKEMQEPLRDPSLPRLPSLTHLAAHTKRLPPNSVSYVPNGLRISQTFANASPVTAYGSNPYTFNQRPMYNVAVAQGEVTHVAVH